MEDFSHSNPMREHGGGGGGGRKDNHEHGVEMMAFSENVDEEMLEAERRTRTWSSLSSDGQSMTRHITAVDTVERSKWVSDLDSNECLICGKRFRGRCNTKTPCRTGRHHCRFCGTLVCADCSTHMVFGKRCCDTCFSRSQLAGGETLKSGHQLKTVNSEARRLLAMGIIVQDAGYFVAFETIVACLTLYVIIWTPLAESVLYGRVPPILYSMDSLATFAFMFDFAFQCRVTHRNHNGDYIEDSREILKSYFRSGRMATDFISSLPFQFIVATSAAGKVMKILLRLLRVLRLPRLLRKLESVLRKFQNVKALVSTFNLFIVFFFFIHIFACGWFYLCILDADDEEGLGRVAGINRIVYTGWVREYGLEHEDATVHYAESFYWAVATITTVGYGDRSATNVTEQWASSFVMIIGNVISASIFGTLAAAISSISAESDKREAKLESVERFLRDAGIKMSLRNRVLQYYEYIWDKKKTWSTETPVSDLPEGLGSQVALMVYSSLLDKSELFLIPSFQNSKQSMKRWFAARLQSLVACPSEILFEEGDSDDAIFFIKKGKIRFLDVSGPIGTHSLSIGEYFGDQHLQLEEDYLSSPEPGRKISTYYRRSSQGRSQKSRSQSSYNMDALQRALGANGSYDTFNEDLISIIWEGTPCRLFTATTTGFTELEFLNAASQVEIFDKFPRVYGLMIRIAARRRMELFRSDCSHYHDSKVVHEAIVAFQNSVHKNRPHRGARHGNAIGAGKNSLKPNKSFRNPLTMSKVESRRNGKMNMSSRQRRQSTITSDLKEGKRKLSVLRRESMIQKSSSSSVPLVGKSEGKKDGPQNGPTPALPLMKGTARPILRDIRAKSVRKITLEELPMD